MNAPKKSRRPRGGLVEAIRGIITRDGIATYSHIRREIPGVSTKSITYAFRMLEEEKILETTGHARNGSVRRVAERGSYHILPVTQGDAYSEELLNGVRKFILTTLNTSTTVIRYVFGLGDKKCDRILWHLHREGIVHKGRQKGGHWRVVIGKDEARKILSELPDNAVQPNAFRGKVKLVLKTEPAEKTVLERLRDSCKGSELGAAIDFALERMRALDALEKDIASILAKASA